MRRYAAHAVSAAVTVGWPPSRPVNPAAPVRAPGPGDLRGPEAASTFSLLQMNLCLSGLADCFGATAYPNVVDEAVSRIRAAQPDAVTVNEACREDGTEIAARTAYHVRFVPVHYAGAPLRCLDPGGRGLFGHAVLTRRPIVRSESGIFDAQAELEERRWLCVSIRDGVDVCTAHLEKPDTPATRKPRTRTSVRSLGQVLARRVSRFTLFGGDVNRLESCAPPGSWSRTDAAADQSPGVQHVYGSLTTEDPVVQVLPSAFSDHDLMLVSARLLRRGDDAATAYEAPGERTDWS